MLAHSLVLDICSSETVPDRYRSNDRISMCDRDMGTICPYGSPVVCGLLVDECCTVSSL